MAGLVPAIDVFERLSTTGNALLKTGIASGHAPLAVDLALCRPHCG